MGVRNTTMRRFPLPRLPLERVHVEVTSHCNFACEFCPNPTLERPGGAMDFVMLGEILDEIAASGLTQQVVFHQQGEPLLFPRLAEAVARGTELGLTTCVTTNGALLDDRRVDELLASKLSRLVVSLQTPDEESFVIRGARGLSFREFEARVVRAVRRVLAAAGPTEVRVAFLTKPLPRLTLPIVGSDWKIVEHNRDLHPLLESWAGRLLEGLDGVPDARAIRKAVRRTGVLHRNEVRLHSRLVLEARPVGFWSMPERDYGRPWLSATRGTCHGISEHIAILWNGDYAFCCADHNGRTSTARFQDLSLLDYLDSEPVQAAFHGFQRLRPVHPYCRQCLGGPHPGIVAVKTIGSVLYFKVLSRLRREARA
ncbi:MAG TPA: radical SAM/SPASM domain-containing protein [Thermoanaerobaculaceae bacterium]|nr:radical SAM/SPASM domain-containing protein [Thermoanaerobaculaceae bacterium]HPS77359.1 radical SAM/SPASM domain-containing protein [Thermoanaerobaculaceae bacterium]